MLTSTRLVLCKSYCNHWNKTIIFHVDFSSAQTPPPFASRLDLAHHSKQPAGNQPVVYLCLRNVSSHWANQALLSYTNQELLTLTLWSYIHILNVHDFNRLQSTFACWSSPIITKLCQAPTWISEMSHSSYWSQQYSVHCLSSSSKNLKAQFYWQLHIFTLTYLRLRRECQFTVCPQYN